MPATYDISHGTRSKYQNHGCRCDDCRAACAAYAREKSQGWTSRTPDARAAENRRRAARRQKPPVKTLIARLTESISVDPVLGCWIPARKPMPNGYVSISQGGRRLYCHRVMYEHHIGPIPAGLHIDHLCRVPACCNPAHLEAVTTQENIRRGLAPVPLSERERFELDHRAAFATRKLGFHDPAVPHGCPSPRDRELAVHYLLTGDGGDGAYA